MPFGAFILATSQTPTYSCVPGPYKRPRGAGMMSPYLPVDRDAVQDAPAFQMTCPVPSSLTGFFVNTKVDNAIP